MEMLSPKITENCAFMQVFKTTILLSKREYLVIFENDPEFLKAFPNYFFGLSVAFKLLLSPGWF